VLAYAPTMDRAVQEYRFRSGAKNTYWIDQLVKYVKVQGLWDAFRIYPFENRTNADTGSTAYGLGGLTSNEMTLVNGPTWGASGLAFARASSQYGSIPDFLGSETVTCLLRTTVGALSAGNALISQYDTGANDRSWIYYKSTLGNEMWLAISDNGTDLARYGGGDSSASTDVCHVVKYGSDGSVQNYLDKTEQTLSINLGTARSSRNDSSVSVLLSAFQSSGSATSFANQTAKALAFLTGTVTDTQRETITDLINEL
jgi:hypothetical protein